MWSAYARSVGGIADARFYEAFQFGDSQAMADELGQLVLIGTKRATTGAVWSFEASGKRLPLPGDLSVVLDGQGTALCIIETTRVDVMPFDAVSAEFAAVEGEGDGSLAFWRQAHIAYFTRECERAGRTFGGGMPVACERFRVVWPELPARVEPGLSAKIEPAPPPRGEAVLRQAVRADVALIQRVRHSVRENRLISRVIGDDEVVDAIERTGRGWVVEAGAQVVAFAVGNAETGNIWALFVDPEHEGQGHGRRLHDAMVGWLWSAGCGACGCLPSQARVRNASMRPRAGSAGGRCRAGNCCSSGSPCHFD
jgi:uncharacterized protein YhfF/GNAT superfamily N-acetyltransferase